MVDKTTDCWLWVAEGSRRLVNVGPWVLLIEDGLVEDGLWGTERRLGCGCQRVGVGGRGLGVRDRRDR